MTKQYSNPWNHPDKQRFKGKQSGQVLLIIVMLLATVLAVTFSVSFTSQTETQTTKLEEDSKRALAASEAILEASLKQPASGTPYSIAALGLTNLSGFNGSASVSETQGNTFVTPLLQRDEQYTLYLSQYDNAAHTFSSPFSGDLYFYMKSESGCPAVELTYVHTDANNSLTRDLIDPCDQVSGSGELPNLQLVPKTNIKGTDFEYKNQNPKPISGDIKVVFMRVLFNATKLGIQRVAGASSVLPPQGKTTTAQAQTNTSVTSTVSLFQSYPQIPSDFFVTSF